MSLQSYGRYLPLTTRTIEDLDTLRAVAHPLRVRLLGLLRTGGPATASQLARAVGESSGSTSYHLRQLERFGFVADDLEQPSGRERHWRALHDITSVPESLPGAQLYLEVFRARQLAVLQAGLAALSEPREGYGMSDYRVRLDPQDVVALRDELHAVLERYAERAGREAVTVHVAVTPGGPAAAS